MDASKVTAHSNAYVSGLGPTRKVVISDNLLKNLPEEEILAVVSHELGHIVHYHHLRMFLITALAVIILNVGFSFAYQEKKFL